MRRSTSLVASLTGFVIRHLVPDSKAWLPVKIGPDFDYDVRW
jgi:hypothetical protein